MRRYDTFKMYPVKLQHYFTPPYYLPGCDVLFSFYLRPISPCQNRKYFTLCCHTFVLEPVFYSMGSAASQKVGMSILSMRLYQGSTVVSSHLCKALETEVNPYQSIHSPLSHMITLCFVTGLIPAAYSLPMRPQLCLSPFWSPYLSSSFNSTSVRST